MMEHNYINQVGELTHLKTTGLHNSKEVCLGVVLSKEMVEEHELTDYDISVYFYDDKDSETAVFIYNNVTLETTSINFSYAARDKIIEFAQQYI